MPPSLLFPPPSLLPFSERPLMATLKQIREHVLQSRDLTSVQSMFSSSRLHRPCPRPRGIQTSTKRADMREFRDKKHWLVDHRRRHSQLMNDSSARGDIRSGWENRFSLPRCETSMFSARLESVLQFNGLNFTKPSNTPFLWLVKLIAHWNRCCAFNQHWSRPVYLPFRLLVSSAPLHRCTISRFVC